MDRKDVKLLSINAGSAVSGAEKVLRDLLAHALAEGEEVVLASPGGPVTTATPSGIRHLEIPHQIPNANPASGSFRKKALTLALPLLWLRTAAALAPEMRRADTVLVNSTFALPAVALASAFSRTRVVWLVHDTLTAGKQKVAARMGAVAVDTAVAVSETTAAVIRPFFREVVVRPNGVEIPADEFFTQQRRRNNEGRVVGMLAAITHWKAQDVLIRALGILRGREGIDVDVEIAGGDFPGSETYAAELSALVSELGLDGHVRFLGHVPKESAFARWDALISASRRPEAGPPRSPRSDGTPCPRHCDQPRRQRRLPPGRPGRPRAARASRSPCPGGEAAAGGPVVGRGARGGGFRGGCGGTRSVADDPADVGGGSWLGGQVSSARGVWRGPMR